MQKKTIYLDVEKHVCVAADKVYMKDVAGLYCKDNDILAKLKEKAEYDDRSLSQYINIVLKQHINSIENKKP